MKNFKKILPYSVAIFLGFYTLPFLATNTGSAIVIMILILPIFCLVVSAVLGFRHGMGIMFPLVVALLFIPTIFIFFNESAWVYCPGYGIVALIGTALGALTRRICRTGAEKNEAIR